MGESNTSEKRLAAAQRKCEALRLRAAGATFQEIADGLGYSSVSGAHKAVVSALRETLQEPSDELRRLESDRLRAMMAAVWPRVEGGDLHAIDRALRIQERLARLLGLDAPARAELAGSGQVQVTWNVPAIPPDSAT